MSITSVNNNDDRYIRDREERREVKIRQKESSEPSESIFDLDDYYSKGYKSDDVNEQEAEVMQADMLEIYDISADDENKEAKLFRIFEQILEDENNAPLYNYCVSHGVMDLKDDPEAFIDGVSRAMAHMSHDKSSVGDDISLNEVDFSGISDSSVDGTIETTQRENGHDVIIRGENDEVVKIISYDVAENGLMTITEYSDADKTTVISQDTGYRFDKSDNEVKFKFGSDKQNTVDITDNGETLTVNVTKGVLNAEYSVDKNADGTFSLNGKQYFTLEELAADLNHKDIPDFSSLDGEINSSMQGKAGDCGLISAINSLSMTEFGRDAIKNAVSVDDAGNVTVKFAAIGQEYTITPNELNNNRFSSGDPDVRAIELAYEKLMQDVNNGTLVRDNSAPYYIFGTDETNYNSSHRAELSTGTYPSSVYYMLTGIKCSQYPYQTDAARFDSLDRMEQDGSVGMSVAYLPQRTSANVNMSAQNNQHKVKDAFGNDVDVYEFHHYAVKESDTLPNGERIITIVNPWNSSEEIVLNQDTFLDCFNTTFDIDYTLEAGNKQYYISA